MAAVRRRRGWATCVLGVALMGLAIGASRLTLERHYMLQTYNIDPSSGLRYTTPLGEPMLPFRLSRDAGPGERRTLVVIKEDGRALGPAEAPLGEIAALGRGRNAHRDGLLHFSTSDATDPRTNGRFYHVTYALQLDRGCLWSILTAGAMLSIAGLAVLHEPGRRQA